MVCFVGQLLTLIALLILPDKHARPSTPNRPRKRKGRYRSGLGRTRP
jgi:hypothetical protein